MPYNLQMHKALPLIIFSYDRTAVSEWLSAHKTLMVFFFQRNMSAECGGASRITQWCVGVPRCCAADFLFLLELRGHTICRNQRTKVLSRTATAFLLQPLKYFLSKSD